MANSVAPTVGHDRRVRRRPGRPRRAPADRRRPGGSAATLLVGRRLLPDRRRWSAAACAATCSARRSWPGSGRGAGGCAASSRPCSTGWSPARGTSGGRRAGRRPRCGATGGHRVLYGILLLMSILLYRNYFYPGSGGQRGARPLHPAGDRLGGRLRARRTGDPGRHQAAAEGRPGSLSCSLPAGWSPACWARPSARSPFLVIGFALGLVAQGVAICATRSCSSRWTTLTGAGCSPSTTCCSTSRSCSARRSPRRSCRTTGKSYPMLIGRSAAGYVLAAGGYLAADGQLRDRPRHPRGLRRRSGGPSPGSAAGAIARPSAAAPERPARRPAGRAPSAARAGNCDAWPTSGPGPQAEDLA